MMNLCQDSIESKNELLKAQHEQEFLESLNQIKTAKHQMVSLKLIMKDKDSQIELLKSYCNLEQPVCWYIFEWLPKGGVVGKCKGLVRMCSNY